LVAEAVSVESCVYFINSSKAVFRNSIPSNTSRKVERVIAELIRCHARKESSNQVTHGLEREQSESSSPIVYMAIDFDSLILAVLNIKGLVVFQVLSLIWKTVG